MNRKKLIRLAVTAHALMVIGSVAVLVVNWMLGVALLLITIGHAIMLHVVDKARVDAEKEMIGLEIIVAGNIDLIDKATKLLTNHIHKDLQ